MQEIQHHSLGFQRSMTIQQGPCPVFREENIARLLDFGHHLKTGSQVSQRLLLTVRMSQQTQSVTDPRFNNPESRLFQVLKKRSTHRWIGVDGPSQEIKFRQQIGVIQQGPVLGQPFYRLFRIKDCRIDIEIEPN